jgi:hypothetical protein
LDSDYPLEAGHHQTLSTYTEITTPFTENFVLKKITSVWFENISPKWLNWPLNQPNRITDINHLCRYRALQFCQPVTQGNHSEKRSLYQVLH